MRFLLTFLLSVSLAFAAVVQPASNRTPPSGAYTRHTAINTIGVGVPGGIASVNAGRSVDNSLLSGGAYDITSFNGTETDVQPYIQDAFTAAWNSGAANKILMLPAGTYHCAGSVKNPSQIGVNAAGGITIRGQGMGVTILKNYGTYIFEFGTGSTFTRTSQHLVSGDLAKGDTTATIANPDFYESSRIMKIYWSDMTNDAAIIAGATPVFHTEGAAQGYTRTQTVYGTNKVGSVMTFVPPILHEPPAGLTAYLVESTFGYTQGIGIEEMTVLRADPFNNAAISTGISFLDSVGCWVKNVEVSGWKNYGIVFTACYRMEIRGCYLHDISGGGSNGAGILPGSTGGLLIENNIVTHVSPLIETNGGASGAVISYNFLDENINTNHGPFNTGILVYGNIGAFVMDDGYFGGSTWLTLVNNWFHGVYNINIATSTGTQTALAAYRRFTFYLNAYNNIYGNADDPYAYDFTTGFGYPNRGNDFNSGLHSEFLAGTFDRSWKARVELTTRTSDHSGVITGVATSYGTYSNVNSGSIPKILTDNYGYLEGITVNSEHVVTFTSSNATLPAVNTQFQLEGPGIGSYQDINDDVWNTKDFRANILLSPSITNFPSQSLAGGDTIWDVLGDAAAGAPAWWGSCPWYGHTTFINRDNTAALSYRDIPAGRRYIDGNALLGETTSGGGTTTATVTNLNVTTLRAP